MLLTVALGGLYTGFQLHKHELYPLLTFYLFPCAPHVMKHLPHSTVPSVSPEDYFTVFFLLMRRHAVSDRYFHLIISLRANPCLRGRKDDLLPVSLSTACSALQICVAFG